MFFTRAKDLDDFLRYHQKLEIRLHNIMLLIEFDGTNYHGWQKQPGDITLQETMETAISRVTGSPTKLVGVGRTDSGVHALGYAANFTTVMNLKGQQWKSALNSLIPDDIVILDVFEKPVTFNARFSAHSKIYDYIVLNRDHPSALYSRYMWHVRGGLDIESIKRTALLFKGEKDFSSFAVTRSTVEKNNVCNLHHVWVKKRNDLLIFSIRGDRFLHNMVRNIVGTLIDVGKRTIDISAISWILEKKDRRLAGRCAPAKGLYLKRVIYPKQKP